VLVNGEGVTVNLIYDPEHKYESNEIIPIHYAACEEFCYIPHDQYIEKFNPEDYGIDSTEIKLIQKIMTYLETHKKELNHLCNQYCGESRMEQKEVDEE
jgi:hypothetical protein